MAYSGEWKAPPEWEMYRNGSVLQKEEFGIGYRY